MPDLWRWTHVSGDSNNQQSSPMTFKDVPMNGRLRVKIILDMQLDNVAFFGVQGRAWRLSIAHEHWAPSASVWRTCQSW